MSNKSKNISKFLLLCLSFNLLLPVFSAEKPRTDCKYCDFSQMYVNEDKFENFNRKMFNLNNKLNKFIARPVHILWSSILPKYGLDRIKGIYDNIEYPKRLASCLIQKDFKGAKTETKRFVTNSTVGLGGMFDPAKKFMKLEPVSENMDQALNHCKVKSGPYLVMPVLSSSCPRSLLGRLLEAALDPSAYIGTPIAALAKLGLVINRTSYMQPLITLLDATYADPYDISKKMFGIESYIKSNNIDRKDLLSTEAKLIDTDGIIANVASQEELDIVKEKIKSIQEEEILSGLDEMAEGTATGFSANLAPLSPDIILENYKPQNPVVDSLRTALFDLPNVNKSAWNDLSIWNHSFANRIKTGTISVIPERESYKYRYILQKNKKAPLAIIYPSIGEGIYSYHSIVFAKLFYDAGYSVVIQGSHFQWEFVKSMPKDFRPGLPKQDAEYLKLVTSKIVADLNKKYNCEFSDKILLGTSFGALATLFVGNYEHQNNTLNISKYIAICPPIELMYAMEQVDKNSEDFDKSSEDSKQKAAIAAAKVIQMTDAKDKPNFEFKSFPFSEEEGKLVVSFIMRQKLSDLIFTIEGVDKGKKTDFYNSMNNISYKDYVEKYILQENGTTTEDLAYDTSLYSLSDFLKNSKNYKIYHSLDDYLINKKQLAQIKRYSPDQVICMNNGSHLGFMYRNEFIDSLKKDINLN